MLLLPANPRYWRTATGEVGKVGSTTKEMEVAGGRRERQIVLRLRDIFITSHPHFLPSAKNQQKTVDVMLSYIESVDVFV